MNEDQNPIVGHKTYRDGDSFRHEPLRSAIMPLIEQVIVKKLGQAMVFTAEQFELKEKVSHAD